MFLTHLISSYDQIFKLFLVMGITLQMLVNSLLADSHRTVELIKRIAYFFGVFSEPPNGGVLKFFLISIFKSSPAMSIIFSKKSILICFWPTIRSSSLIRTSMALSLSVLLDFISITRCPLTLKVENL